MYMRKKWKMLLLSILTLSQVVAQQDRLHDLSSVKNDERLIGEKDFRESSILISDLDKQAQIMKETIRNTPTKIDVQGKSYYFAQNGNDSNHGLSPEKPLKTLEKLNSLTLEPGDAVLFKRGDLWRGAIYTKKGVTYSAYGEGEKPRIYGSPYDASKIGKWIETENPNIYMYDQELLKDIGTLVFNEGEACAMKVMKFKQQDGTTVHIETKESFNDYRDLNRDLDFYHDYLEEKR